METKVIAENATHKAIIEHGQISIYLKEFDFEGQHHPEEFLYAVSEDMEDDIIAIFEQKQFDFINSAYMVEESLD